MQVYLINTLYNLHEPNLEVSSEVELFLLKKDAENRMTDIITHVETTVKGDFEYSPVHVTHEKTTDGEFYELHDYDENNFVTVTLGIEEVK